MVCHFLSPFVFTNPLLPLRYRYMNLILRKILLVLALLMMAFSSLAQDFSIKGTLPGVKGQIWLIIYDNDSTPRQISCRINGGPFSFRGSLKGAQGPVYAEIQQSKISRPIPLFLDASQITIDINKDDTWTSKITGSRPTSQLRYALEICKGEGYETCLVDHIKKNPTAFYAPFLLNYVASTIDYKILQETFAQLSGDAVSAYHYHLLQKRIGLLSATVCGERLPDFIIPVTEKRSIHFDSLQKDSTYLVLSFGATWCASCQKANKEMEGVIKAHNVSIKKHKHKVRLCPVTIDKDPRQWDNPMLRQLGVEYIPYIIIVDPEGKTLFRDLRYWELERTLRDLRKEMK